MNRILIIDDNEQNREILGLVFQDEHCDVEMLASPQGIEKVLENFSPDVLLMDVMMAGFNGIRVCHELKSDPKFSCLKIVLLTASNAFLNLDPAMVAADAYIAKPFDIQEVTTIVAELIEAKA